MTYKVQVDDEVRDATPEEILEIEATQAEAIAKAEAEAEKAAARQAVLDRLGLTAEEAQLILGGSN